MPVSNSKVNITANVQAVDKSTNIAEKSLKSQRTYQVGVVFKDIYGRETPVFTDKAGTFTVPKAMCNKVNSITTTLNSQVPSWVDTYKFFVKETSNEYYNACMDRWYDSEDGNLWLSFPSAERNKIQEEGFIILKKQASSQDAVIEEARYKVIDIKNEAPEDIKTYYELYGNDQITVKASGAVAGTKTITFTGAVGANDWKDSVFYDQLVVDDNKSSTGFIGWPLDSVAIKLQNASGTNTGWMDVANIYEDSGDFKVELSKPMQGNSVDGGIIDEIIIDSSSNSDVTVKIAKKVVKNKKEFDGKFFVKIARDAVLEEKVREVGTTNINFSVDAQVKQYSLTQSSADSTQSFWQSVGENWFIDDASRANVGTGTGINYNGPYDRDNGFGIKGDTGFGRSGDAQSSLRCTMELTLNNINDTNKDGYDISNNSSENQTFYEKIQKKGTLFRWKEDPYQHIYRVVSCKNSQDHNGSNQGPPNHSYKKGILNFSSYKHRRKDPENKCIRLYLTFVTAGYRLSAVQSGGVFGGTYETHDAGLRPFDFQNQYTPPTGNWKPIDRGYGQYTSSTPADATGNINQNTSSFNDNANKHNTIQIVKLESGGDEEPVFTDEPAIWETEPREDVGLDIYYEASQAYPARLTDQTNELFAPYGCTVTCVDVINNKTFFLPEGTQLYDWAPSGNGGNTLLLTARADKVGILNKSVSTVNDGSTAALSPAYLTTLTGGQHEVNGVTIDADNSNTLFLDLQNSLRGLELRFIRHDGSYTTANIAEFSVWSPNNQNFNPNIGTPPQPNAAGNYPRIKITLKRNLSNNTVRLPYFNCYSFGNGVESDRIRDDFNQVRIGKGVKASTVPPVPYKEESKTNGLIYSGIWNSNNGINRLNQFIAAEKITKDVSPTYGSIQKIKARDTDLVTFCEDKILKIQAYKDALYSADGKPQLIASNSVLGDVSSFAGEFGISTNPESYAEDGFRMYCTDKQRGEVLRISMDGITPISNMGMDDYFGDNLKLNQELIGSFDDRKDEYNISLQDTSGDKITVSFSEKAKGWTSFKSFIPEDGVSINNNYYTFKNGTPYIHHTNEIRNNFYDVQYDSYLDLVFNEMPSVVKNFTYMVYEGTQSKITQNLGHTDANGVFYPDNEYYNNIAKDGWYIENGFTDLQEAGGMEFKDKEGKWFSYMKGTSVKDISDLNSKEITFQGIATFESIRTEPDVDPGNDIFGCTDPTALNYDPLATADDGSCILPIHGCTNPNATNYDPNANVDDGSCIIPPPAPTTFTITFNEIGDED
tara:strand:- start:7925 stop:11758 length:3834 start_codon:yes stop_codon:yes gene_type:complete